MTYVPNQLVPKDFIQVTLSTDTASTSDNGGNRCTFDNIIASGDNSAFTLTNGKINLANSRKYKLSSYVVTTQAENIEFYDFTNGIPISPRILASQGNNANGSFVCIVEPTGDIDVGISSDNTSTFESGTAKSSMLVEKIL